MNPMTLFAANVVGNEKNTRYPHQRVITNSEELKDAVAYDHVTATYQANTRSASGFVGSDCVVMDIDNDHTTDPTQWITPEGLAEVFPLLAFYTATSRNHMVDKGMLSARPRFHIYFPIQPCSRAEDYVALKKTLAAQYAFFDANALDAARFIYGNPDAEVLVHEGNVLVDEFLADSVVDEFAVFDQHTQHIHEGSRNATMSRFAGRVLIRYGDSEAAKALFDRKAALCDPPLEAGELETIWRSARRFATKIAADPGYVPPHVWEQLNGLKPDDYTDIGQAMIMAVNYLDQVRYSPATKYLAYSGGVWHENEQIAHGLFQQLTERQLTQAQQALETAKQHATSTGASQLLAAMSKNKALTTMTDIQRQAYQELEQAQTWLAFVYKCRSSKAIQAAMKETQPLVLINPSELDPNPYLLCTPGGTLDLREGIESMRENRSADLITHQTSLTPNKEHGWRMWEDTLNTIFQGDVELIGYVQRICGLAAIGKVMVEALIIAYGDEANGKSTFWNTIARVLGSYADSINAEVLIAGVKNNAKNDMAETRGKRLLIAAETEEGKRLSTAAAKQLASTDKIAAEKKYKDPFSFTPSHSLVLYTNHLPKVGAMDTGIWRRLIVIPFEAKIEGGADVKNYADHLYEHAGGAILAWIIEGARLIHLEGYKLTAPQRVVEATNSYKESNDWFAHFLDDTCQLGSALEQPSGALYQAYRAWALATGEYVRSTRDFYAALTGAGYTRRRTNQGWLIRGLVLTNEFTSN